MNYTIFNELAVGITDSKVNRPSHRYTRCILLLSWAHCREGVRNSMNGLVHDLRSNQAKMVEDKYKYIEHGEYLRTRHDRTALPT